MKTKTNILEQNIWLNSEIKVNNQVLFYQNWAEKGVTEIHHLCDENEKLLNFEQFTGKYGIKIPFTKFFGLISAIPKGWRGQLYKNSGQEKVLEEPDPHKIDNLLGTKKPGKTVYQGIIKAKRVIPHAIISKWEEEAGVKMDHSQWLKGLLYSKNHSVCSKIRSHMYKFALRDVSYNARLFQMKLVDSPNCKWCPGTKESLIHLYWAAAFEAL